MFRHSIFCILIYIITAKHVLEHGEFDMMVTKYEACRGPKRKNCTESTAEIEDKVFLAFDFHVIEDMTTIRGKIIGMLNNKELLRIQIKNACDHIFFRPLFQMIFNQADRCGITKGHYIFRLNVAEISRKFYGGTFIYGNWSFSTVLYNDYCNLNCNHVELVMFPKTT